ncbi:hypothetical protein Anapl_06552 [Anas platyrhynchos]|uniref:Uncharacterized protein n=1 Tax=Anas platyrhynchos TaxID=8839 RepID=R0JNN6_ANAPL|nr:hypothetical protein Anapl_06552 [Anas platyrhynchos]
MARTRGGGRSVTKKGLGERGHEIFTSHTYTSPNTLSSGLPTCWGGARRQRVSKRTRQEHANHTQCGRRGHGCSPQIAEQVAKASLGSGLVSAFFGAVLSRSPTLTLPGCLQGWQQRGGDGRLTFLECCLHLAFASSTVSARARGPVRTPRDAGWDAAAPALCNVCTVLVQSGVHTCQPEVPDGSVPPGSQHPQYRLGLGLPPPASLEPGSTDLASLVPIRTGTTTPGIPVTEWHQSSIPILIRTGTTVPSTNWHRPSIPNASWDWDCCPQYQSGIPGTDWDWDHHPQHPQNQAALTWHPRYQSGLEPLPLAPAWHPRYRSGLGLPPPVSPVPIGTGTTAPGTNLASPVLPGTGPASPVPTGTGTTAPGIPGTDRDWPSIPGTDWDWDHCLWHRPGIPGTDWHWPSIPGTDQDWDCRPQCPQYQSGLGPLPLAPTWHPRYCLALAQHPQYRLGLGLPPPASLEPGSTDLASLVPIRTGTTTPGIPVTEWHQSSIPSTDQDQDHHPWHPQY